MDHSWVEKTRGMSVKDQWELLYKEQSAVSVEGRSVWLPKGDIFKHAENLIATLPELFKELNIKTFVDVGCSDFIWQSKVEWKGVEYLGYDIVEGIVDDNKIKYPEYKFECKNLIEDDCIKADMVFIRNVLLHTTIDGIFKIVNNIKRSGSTYLMASTMPTLDINRDTTGIWVVRKNLQIEPFNFPEPLHLIKEIRTDDINNYMGVWKVNGC